MSTTTKVSFSRKVFLKYMGFIQNTYFFLQFGLIKRTRHFSGKTFLYQPRHCSITLRWNVQEKILPCIYISKSFLSVGISSVPQVFLRSHLAAFQTTSNQSSFVFTYLNITQMKGLCYMIHKHMLHSKILCSFPSASASTPSSTTGCVKGPAETVFSLQGGEAMFSCQAAMNLQQTHTVCISWLFVTVSKH